jgi:hypothetical protein
MFNAKLGWILTVTFIRRCSTKTVKNNIPILAGCCCTTEKLCFEYIGLQLLRHILKSSKLANFASLGAEVCSEVRN